jgi:hypothetical protein
MIIGVAVLSEEHRLRTLENKVLKRLCGQEDSSMRIDNMA